MHIVTPLSDKYQAMRNPENGWSEQEAGMAQLDDIVGDVLAKLKKDGMDDTTYIVHLDGYDQTPMITGKGPSNRHEVFYFGESALGAIRIDDFKYRFIDQPGGWLGAKVTPDMPVLTNLRLDPFERAGWPENMAARAAMAK
ncbi:arylsulfatase A-like enzyme [Pseudomonas baetica]|nr:arylsulfatase A-like enzyme [Pseudomonas baetica]